MPSGRTLPRRRLLRTAAGACAGSLALAGCLGSTPESTGDETTTDTTGGTTALTTSTDTTAGGTEKTTTGAPTTDSEPPAVREVAPSDVDRGVPRARDLRRTEATDPELAFAVGERPADTFAHKTHVVAVWNDTEAALSVALVLTTDGTTLLDRTVELDPGQPGLVELREPRAYELTIRAGDRAETVTVERSRLDCNNSATDVLVGPENVETSTITTSMACSTTTA
ncbi:MULTISPECIES: hypothetical protein [Halorussus]|uniref:hypothetical protein n=1 Tax=Halorussus TaxID=1070314 RepID=UPI0020A08B2F|nr:hypothetical protein [Halorussus vallis]USZ77514.1 hypothetical protein NGM07_09300 [Halorussus vallis]